MSRTKSVQVELRSVGLSFGVFTVAKQKDTHMFSHMALSLNTKAFALFVMYIGLGLGEIKSKK